MGSSAALVDCGRSAVHGQAVHEEIRVVGTTLFHCDLAQQSVMARLATRAALPHAPHPDLQFPPGSGCRPFHPTLPLAAPNTPSHSRYTVPEGTIAGAGGTAAFADFVVRGRRTRGLCVVRGQGQSLAVYLPGSGELHEVGLPPPPGGHAGGLAWLRGGGARLWPLDVGVLVAYPPPSAPSPSAGVPGGGARDEEGAGAPLLFTLTHPLDALRPVSLPGGLGGGFGGGFGGGLTMRATGGVGTGGCMGGGGGGSGRGAAAGQEGAERVVWAGRRPGWPLAVLVTRSGGDGARRGRRTVWGLRRLRAEGIDGDR